MTLAASMAGATQASSWRFFRLEYRVVKSGNLTGSMCRVFST
jgi:hypothetical protein